jgi:N-acetyl-gamma-glutamyl-phosphate reductase
MIRIGIIGASGYTGLELLRLLQHHPAARVVWLTSENSAGQCLGDIFAVPPPLGHLPLIPLAAADLADVDLVFCCLPHVSAQGPVAAARNAGARVVDLSADYRLRDTATYETWYSHPHTQPALLAEAVYGLPELHREDIAHAGLVANPGCYATSVILGLAPLERAGWMNGTVIADSKSGVSGAGRQPSLKTHFVEANENLSPYSIGRAHRHIAEIEQELGMPSAGREFVFSPHLVPLNRGMLSTIYVTLPEGVMEAEVRRHYEAMYAHEPFVYLLKPSAVATVAHTQNTNYCAIGLTSAPGTRTVIVTSSIDNLVKGASGQAVQNMNIMFALDERTGLE